MKEVSNARQVEGQRGEVHLNPCIFSSGVQRCTPITASWVRYRGAGSMPLV